MYVLWSTSPARHDTEYGHRIWREVKTFWKDSYRPFPVPRNAQEVASVTDARSPCSLDKPASTVRGSNRSSTEGTGTVSNVHVVSDKASPDNARTAVSNAVLVRVWSLDYELRIYSPRKSRTCVFAYIVNSLS